MIREMLRISLLLAGATIGLTAGHPPAYAQTVPQPAARANVPLMVPNYGGAAPLPAARPSVPLMEPSFGTNTSPNTNTYQRLDAAQNNLRAQSCGAMSGAAADRCYSDLRAKITSDDLRQRSIDSSFTRRDKEEKGK